MQALILGISLPHEARTISLMPLCLSKLIKTLVSRLNNLAKALLNPVLRVIYFMLKSVCILLFPAITMHICHSHPIVIPANLHVGGFVS